VPTHLIGNDAFQECDTVGITRPCTKHNWLVRRIEDLPKVLHEALDHHIKEEERTESYPVVSYRPEKLSKEVSYTVYVPESKTETYTVTRQEQVPDHRIETYLTRVAVPVVKEVDVQVAKMIPKVISVTVNPCGGPATAAGQQRSVTVVPVSCAPPRDVALGGALIVRLRGVIEAVFA
jgi:hypothetical protein